MKGKSPSFMNKRKLSPKQIAKINRRRKSIPSNFTYKKESNAWSFYDKNIGEIKQSKKYKVVGANRTYILYEQEATALTQLIKAKGLDPVKDKELFGLERLRW